MKIEDRLTPEELRDYRKAKAQDRLNRSLAGLDDEETKKDSEAGVYTCRGIADLHGMVSSLAEQGFRIITVIDTQNGDYHVVAQKETS